MTLNLTEREAEVLLITLQERRQRLLFAADKRQWRRWPEGKVYAKLCKLLGRKR